MMNRLDMKNFVLLLVSATVGVACAQPFEKEAVVSEDDKVLVNLELNAFTQETRSYFSPDENRVRDVNLFVYAGDGSLVESFYGAPEDCVLSLNRGQVFDFYVLANYGSAVDPPYSSRDLTGLVLDFQPSGLKDGCIPMAGSRTSCLVTPGVPVSISVERLFAKLGVKVDESRLSTATFVYKSLSLKQCPTHIAPWKEDFYEELAVADGDRASDGDMAVIAEEECFFYVPENRRMIDYENSDPWQKIPSRLECEALLPYIEICASYEDHGLSAGNTNFRFYLGGNATDDFDVARNRVYHVTLFPSDDGIFKGSWKLEAEGFTNRRSLSFDKTGFSLSHGSSIDVNLLVEPADLDYVVEYDQALWSEYGVVLTRQGKRFTITSAYSGTVARSLELRVSDRNGYASALCSFSLRPMRTPELKVEGLPVDIWGGVNYTLKCLYTNELGEESVVTAESCTISLSNSVPSSMLTYSGGVIKAADWWGRSGAWTGTQPEYVIVLSYKGVQTRLVGRLHGHVGFDAPQTMSAYYRDVTTSTLVTPSQVFLRGSDRTDVSGNMATSSVKLNGSLVGGISSVWKGQYLKIGTYDLECRYVDPSNNKTRTLALPVEIVSNVKSLTGTVGFRVHEDSKGGHGDYYANFSVSAESSECDLGLQMYCGYEEEIRFLVKGEGLRYVDFNGIGHTVDQYDIWTGSDLYAGFDDFYIDEFTGEDSILLEMNGFEFRLGYRVN